jgi:hypothetical protein
MQLELSGNHNSRPNLRFSSPLVGRAGWGFIVRAPAFIATGTNVFWFFSSEKSNLQVRASLPLFHCIIE